VLKQEKLSKLYNIRLTEFNKDVWNVRRGNAETTEFKNS